jgi:SAM-dependent methyltransferase
MTLSDAATIKKMWAERALSTPTSDKVTHRDTFQRRLEIAELSRHLRPNDLVLDIGCGNGWATAQLAALCRHVTGVDYSEEMIARARAEYGHVNNAEWRKCDVLALNESCAFDAVITVRCLINIVDRGKQWKAIGNIHQAIKAGGRLLMMEGIQDGRQELNRIRQAVGLAPMPTVHHNLDFVVNDTMTNLKTLFSSVNFISNGIYDLLTRVLYPLMITPNAPVYDSPYHDAAFAIAQSAGDCERLARFGLFVCVK